jgi:hypothetical protein
MIDTPTAVEAADNWRILAELVPLVRLYLEPRRGHSEAGRTAPKSKPPIDLGASDLLFDLDVSASFYCSALMFETADVKRMPDALEDQLRLIAKRYGHFTADPDEKIALDFCDEAEELVRKVELLIVQPLPPQWAGPCAGLECVGGMFQSKAQGTAKCDTCGALMTFSDWAEWLARKAEIVLMDRREILDALKMLGHPTERKTLDKWVTRKRVLAVTSAPEMFRLSEVLCLAEKSRRKVAA